MTPQTQAEQKAREMIDSIIGKFILTRVFPEESVKELALLFQKADALDWLEINRVIPDLDGGCGSEFSLLSAINQARKEQG